MRGTQLVAVAGAVLLALLAWMGWREDVAFRARAATAPATLVRFEEREVRSLFATESVLHPVVRFEDREGAVHEFEANVEAARVGLDATDAAGTALEVPALYDPDAPARARLNTPGAARGPLLLGAAALLLLLAPRILAFAFRAR